LRGLRNRACTPSRGFAEGKAKTAEEIRELMSGNICRCGAYPNIVAAIQQVMERSTSAPPIGASRALTATE
jgi:aerobic-type carbon monoxide dehydrogenase small subunit (CoxS/CutS family)